MGQKTHVMHGRDHLCRGADPIPGICDLFPGTPGVAYGDYIADLGLNLLGYWRLGEGSSPYADTSGHAGGPADMNKNATGVAMTESIVGALPAEDDDGAVQFNSPGGSGDELVAASPVGGPRFNFASGNLTIAAWVKPLAHGSSFTGHVAGAWYKSIPDADFGGYRLTLSWPSRTPNLQRAVPAGTEVIISGADTLIADTWYLLVGTYDTSAGAKLYVNGELVDSDPTLFAASVPNLSPSIGRVHDVASSSDHQSFYGGVDEVAIWADALTAAQIAGLYEAGTLGSPGTATPAGQVLTSDGAGGVSYEWPTVKVDGARYDEILPGTGLTATDNADGTVTLAATGGGGGDPVDDSQVWMPLTTVTGGTPELVWDADDSLIPTLIPL